MNCTTSQSNMCVYMHVYMCVSASWEVGQVVRLNHLGRFCGPDWRVAVFDLQLCWFNLRSCTLDNRIRNIARHTHTHTYSYSVSLSPSRTHTCAIYERILMDRLSNVNGPGNSTANKLQMTLPKAFHYSHAHTQLHRWKL